MLVTLGRRREIERSNFLRSMYAAAMAAEEEMSSSSSIGRNSDSSHGRAFSDGEEAEVQSSFKGPLDTMEVLEESLGVRRGISKFYSGKSKSFTNFKDVFSSSTSAKDLAKPDNTYSRKRKVLMAFNILQEESQKKVLAGWEDGIARRPMNLTRSPGGMPFARSSTMSNTSSSDEEVHEPSRLLPPLHAQGNPATTVNSASTLTSSPLVTISSCTRSFSMRDLQGVGSSSSSPIRGRDKEKRS